MVKNIAAVVVLIMLVVTAYFMFSEPSKDELANAKHKIQPVPLKKIDSIRILNPQSGEDDKKPVEILLVKDGAKWSMAKPVKYQIIEGLTEKMTAMLSEIKTVDLISKNRAKHEELEVGDKLGVLVEAFNGKTKLISLVIGTMRNGMTFVRKSGSDEVYRIMGSHKYTFKKTSDNLRVKDIFNLDMDESNVREIAFTKGAATGEESSSMLLVKDGDGENALLEPKDVEIQNLDRKKLKRTISTIFNLKARGFADGSPPLSTTGLDDSAFKIVFKAKKDDKDKNIEILIGKEESNLKQVYVKTSLSEQIFLVMGSSANSIKLTPDSLARTDEEVEKEKEQEKKKSKAPAPGTMSPDIMEKLKSQMSPEMLKKLQAHNPAQVGQ